MNSSLSTLVSQNGGAIVSNACEICGQKNGTLYDAGSGKFLICDECFVSAFRSSAEPQSSPQSSQNNSSIRIDRLPDEEGFAIDVFTGERWEQVGPPISMHCDALEVMRTLQKWRAHEVRLTTGAIGHE